MTLTIADEDEPPADFSAYISDGGELVPPTFAVKPWEELEKSKEDLQRCHTSKEPSADIWRLLSQSHSP